MKKSLFFIKNFKKKGVVGSIFAALFIFGVAVSFYFGTRISSDGIRITRNFYEIDPGKLYRSAQLTGPELNEAITKYGIKTIINLRGTHPGRDWYDNEIQAAKARGVNHVDISMTVQSIPLRTELEALLDAFQNAPRPILIHCQSGADRTGEAVAIYGMEYMHFTKEQALSMLGIKYWHVPMMAPSKRYFISVYKGQDWARTAYNHCDKEYLYADRRGCWRDKYLARKLDTGLPKSASLELLESGPENN